MPRSFINWPAVCGLENSDLIALISNCTDEGILASLRQGFPDLFIDEPMLEPRVPWSAIIRWIREDVSEKFGAETHEKAEHFAATHWNRALVGHFPAHAQRRFAHEGCFPIPHVEFRSIPRAILRQMIGQKFGWDGVRILWRGNEYVVSYTGTKFRVAEFEGMGVEFDDASWQSAVGRRITRLVPSSDDRFCMVAVRFIDFSK